MLKLIGAGMTLAACGSIGVTWARIYEKRPQQLVAIECALQLLETEILYGAITIGEVWRFALLERQTKQLIKDVHTFRFPEDSLDIFSILTGILNNKALEK